MEQREERATVTVIRGHGADRIRQAIAAGIVNQDLKKDVDEVIAENETLRRDLKMARVQLDNERKLNDKFKAVYYDAMRAKQRDDSRKMHFSNVRNLAVLFGFAFTIILLCTLITNAIFR